MNGVSSEKTTHTASWSMWNNRASAGAVAPLRSDLTTKELLRVLAYPNLALEKDEIDELLSDYRSNAEVWSAAVPRSGVHEPNYKDVMFVDLAIAAKADFLVSGGKRLADLGDSGPVKVVMPDELRKLMSLQRSDERNRYC